MVAGKRFEPTLHQSNTTSGVEDSVACLKNMGLAANALPAARIPKRKEPRSNQFRFPHNDVDVVTTAVQWLPS